MIVDLKPIFVNDNSSLPIDYALDMTDFELSGLFPLKNPVKINGLVYNKASLIRLEATITYVYDAPCDRCGDNAVEEITVKLEKSLAVSIEGEESDTIIALPDMKLDLDDLVYTETVLSIPTKHLCSATCKGICYKCGKNLNEGKCECPEKEIDPRLQALADLLK